MSVILYLIGASLIIGGGGLAVFLWSLALWPVPKTSKVPPTASCSTTKNVRSCDLPDHIRSVILAGKSANV